MSDLFLIEKRGMYYRPQSAGYTGVKREAGRYTFDEAAVHGGPNGPDGGLDGISIWKEDEAPDFSSACSWDVRMIEKMRQEIAGEISALKAENERLRGSLSEISALIGSARAMGAVSLGMSHEIVSKVDSITRAALQQET